MRAAYFLGSRTIETRPLRLRAPGPGQALLRVLACGVCGTDVHIFAGGKGSASVTPPVILGHELSGAVEALGPGVTGLKAGDLVSVDPNIYCGTCPSCRQGRKQLCRAMEAVGVTMDGGFADQCLAPASQCVVLPAGTDPELAALTEPLACCLHGIDRAAIRPGETVLILGGSTIGLMMLQRARLCGAARVVVSEPVAARRGLALELGADGAVDPLREDLAERTEALLGGGANVVIECVGGRTGAAAQAVDAAGPGGRILLFGVPHPEALLETSLCAIYQKELTILGSFVNPDTHSRAAALIASGRLRLKELITHRFPVDRLREAIETQAGPESIKVLVVPEED